MPLGMQSLSGEDGERQSGICRIGAGMTLQHLLEETTCPFFQVIREGLPSTGMLSC